MSQEALSRRAIDAYAYLLTAGPTARSVVLERFGPSVDQALAELSQAQLVHGDEVLVGVHPTLAALKVQVRAKLMTVQFDQILSLYGEADAAIIDELTDPQDKARAFEMISATATQEVCLFATHPFRHIKEPDSPADQDATRRGVVFKLLLEQRILEDRETFAFYQRSLDDGAQIRTMNALPFKLYMADDRLALIPGDRPGGDSIKVVGPGSHLRCLRALFDLYWDKSLAVPGGDLATYKRSTADTLCDMDRAILCLMLKGGTDRAIASSLNRSPATVRRHIGHLKSLVGAETREQLIWEASKRDWLPGFQPLSAA